MAPILKLQGRMNREEQSIKVAAHLLLQEEEEAAAKGKRELSNANAKRVARNAQVAQSAINRAALVRAKAFAVEKSGMEAARAGDAQRDAARIKAAKAESERARLFNKAKARKEAAEAEVRAKEAMVQYLEEQSKKSREAARQKELVDARVRAHSSAVKSREREISQANAVHRDRMIKKADQDRQRIAWVAANTPVTPTETALWETTLCHSMADYVLGPEESKQPGELMNCGRGVRKVTFAEECRVEDNVHVVGDGACVVCWSGFKSHLCVPCGHLCLCAACSDLEDPLAHCPICRTDITEIVKLFSV